MPTAAALSSTTTRGSRVCSCSAWRCSSAARRKIASASWSVNPSGVNCSRIVVTTDAPPYRDPLAPPPPPPKEPPLLEPTLLEPAPLEPTLLEPSPPDQLWSPGPLLPYHALCPGIASCTSWYPHARQSATVSRSLSRVGVRRVCLRRESQRPHVGQRARTLAAKRKRPMRNGTMNGINAHTRKP